jgi:hypothetical protein
MKKIQVTKKDIRSGDPGFSRSCPVALAVIRTYPDAVAVRVFKELVRIDTRYMIHSVLNPRSVQRFVRRFDKGKKVQPFNFLMKEIRT